MPEVYDKWIQASQCKHCGVIYNKEVKWMTNFFEPVCRTCGARNYSYAYNNIFSPVTVRAVRSRYLRRFIRWEFHEEAE